MSEECVRKFKIKGVRVFREWRKRNIDESNCLKPNLTPEIRKEYRKFLFDKEYTEIFDEKAKKISVTEPFKDRVEFCIYLDDIFLNCDKGKVMMDNRLWTWLSVFYLEKLIKKEKGKDFLGEESRFVSFDDDDIKSGKVESGRGTKRNLLKSQYKVYRNMGGKSDLDLCYCFIKGDLGTGGEFIEQFVTSQEIAKNPNAIRALREIYFDENNEEKINKVTGKTLSQDMRHVKLHFKKMANNWYLPQCSTKQIIEMLKSFGDFYEPYL